MSKTNRFIQTALFNTPLLISDSKLDEILAFVDVYEAGQNMPFDVVEQPQPIYEGRKVVIPIYGVISQRMNLIQKASGGVSTGILSGWIQKAVSDPYINEIILDIDSPGGSVDGVATLAEQIYQARDIKQITAYVNSSALSAAYWIASASNKVVMSSPTAVAGSIGVVAVHKDISKAEEKAGIKTTEIVAGQYKRIASQYKPLSEDGIKDLQDKVNYIYKVFVDAVSRYRGVSIDHTLNVMADGKVFIGRQAIDVGLADDISKIYKSTNGGAIMVQETVDIDAIRSDAYQQGINEGKSQALTMLEQATAEAVSAERSRVMAILSLQFAAEFPQVIKQAIADGTRYEDVAVALLNAVSERGITMQDVKSGAVMAEVVKQSINAKEDDPLIADIKRRYS